jgi:hypothetical protein
MAPVIPADLAVFLATWNAQPRPPVAPPVYPKPHTHADAKAGRPVPF